MSGAAVLKDGMSDISHVALCDKSSLSIVFFSDGHAKATTTNHLFHNLHLISLLIVNDFDVSRSFQHSSWLIDNFLDQLMAQVAKIFIRFLRE